MPKLRKQRRRKVYRHNINRKRLRNKISNTGNIGCKDVKDAWDIKKSVETNLSQMGLSYDPNKTIGIPDKKKKLKLSFISNKSSEWNEETLNELNEPAKGFVAEKLEQEANAPREKRLKLPKSQVEWITYLIKKYDTDYKSMARDSKNYYQETWKQLRQKVRLFKKIPEQYNKFLQENNLQPEDLSDMNMSDDEL